MKKILFLLFAFVTVTMQAQIANGSETQFEAVQITNPQTVSTTANILSIGTDGTAGKVAGENITTTYAPINYSPGNSTIKSQFSAIDTRLGQISSTSAGITQRVYFTADNTTVSAGTFFTSSLTGKGTASSGSPPALVLGDNTKGYFTKDIISSGFASTTIAYAGTYSGNLTVSASPTPNATQQRFTVEIYKTDNSGNPIPSGVPSAPTGNLGVTVFAILDSGVVNLVDGAITNVPVSGILTQNTALNTGERLRYHVSAAKIGAGGGNVTFGVYYGNAYNSYYDVAVAVTTDAVVNKSTVTGVTDTDALNNLYKPTLSSINATDFNDVYAQNPFTLIAEKRQLKPEISHLTAANAPLFAWGDSLTAGAGGTPYTNALQGLIFHTVTNRGVGGETSTQIKNRLVAETASYSKSVIIWAGRNNYTDPTTVKADIATMISTIGHTRYLVVGIINGDYATEYINQPGWSTIQQLNADLKALYGKKFIDIRPYLVSLHDNSAQDLIDFANDIVPTSLRSDNLHLNTAGYAKVAEYINQRLGFLYELEGYLQSKDIGYYTNTFGILNQGSVTQTANFQINGAGISQAFITRNAPQTGLNATHYRFQNGSSNRWSYALTGLESTGVLGSNLALVTHDNTGLVVNNPIVFFRSGNIIIRDGSASPAVDRGYKLDVTGNAVFDGSLNLGVVSGSGALNFPAQGTGFGTVTSVQKTATGLGIKTGTSGSYVNLITDDTTVARDIRFPDASGTLLLSLSGSAVLDFPSTAAGTSSELSFTLTGAADGDVIALGIPNASTNVNSCFTVRASAANTVTVKFNNYSALPIDPASGTFKAKSLK